MTTFSSALLLLVVWPPLANQHRQPLSLSLSQLFLFLSLFHSPMRNSSLSLSLFRSESEWGPHVNGRPAHRSKQRRNTQPEERGKEKRNTIEKRRGKEKKNSNDDARNMKSSMTAALVCDPTGQLSLAARAQNRRRKKEQKKNINKDTHTHTPADRTQRGENKNRETAIEK